MGILERLFGKKDLRNDPRCPVSVAQARVQGLYPSGAKLTFGGFRKDPNHPVCRQCSRRNDKMCA